MTEKERALEIARDIITLHFGSQDRVGADDDIVAAYIPDSLDVMEIIVAFEKATSTRIPDDAIAQLRTPSDLVNAAK